MKNTLIYSYDNDTVHLDQSYVQNKPNLKPKIANISLQNL